MKLFKSLLILTATVTAAAHAQSPMSPGRQATPMAEAQKEASPSATEMSEGEVRKVNKDTQKITLKHGEIKNLDMPGMTMVFRVKDPAMLDQVKAGDKIRFRAEMQGSAIVLTDIQATR